MEGGIPRVLSIAGSDPSGGAGIQADLKTFTALGVYGMAALTSLTSQNTVGVRGLEGLPASFIADQVDAITEDIGSDALKTGMLDTIESVEKVHEVISKIIAKTSGKVKVVIDPVMVSTSGHTLLRPEAIVKLRDTLVSLCTLVTPNIPEAELLLDPPSSDDASVTAPSASKGANSKSIDSIAKMKMAARDLTALGPSAALVKGGHIAYKIKDIIAEGNGADSQTRLVHTGHEQPLIIQYQTGAPDKDKEFIVDVLYNKSDAVYTIFTRPRVDTSSTHGTGCTLSAAIASYLALGCTIWESTTKALRYTQDAISAGFPLGKGHGPLNHMHNIIARSLPKSGSQVKGGVPYSFVSQLIASASTDGLWDAYVHHPFVKQLGQGRLAQSKFVYFLRQDYLFLMHYARIHSLGAYKARTFEEIEGFQTIVKYILDERHMHVKYCEGFGIDRETLLRTEEDMANVSYTRWVMDIAMSKSTLDLRVATSACLLGYGEAGLWLVDQANKQADDVAKNGNPYWTWVLSYASANFQEAVKIGMEALEKAVEDEPPSANRLADLIDTFRFAVKLEIGFWDSAMAH